MISRRGRLVYVIAGKVRWFIRIRIGISMADLIRFTQ
jgi:hypothetical protein